MGKIKDFAGSLSKASRVFWETFELASIMNLGKDVAKKKVEAAMNVDKHRNRLARAVLANSGDGYSQANIMRYLDMATDKSRRPQDRKYPDDFPFPFMENKVVGLIGAYADDDERLREFCQLLDRMTKDEFVLFLNILDNDVITQLVTIYGCQLLDMLKTAKDKVIDAIGVIYAMTDPIQRLKELGREFQEWNREVGNGMREFREQTTIPPANAARSKADNTLRQRMKRVSLINAIKGQGRS